MAEKSYIQRQREQSEGAKRRRERSGDSRSNLQVRQDEDQQRKFDKAVAAGVDPAVAARAFNVTREGTTDFVAIQSKEGVGVTARTKQGGRTTQAQEFFSRQEGSGSLGAEFAIPTDADGRSPTDQMIRARSQPVPSSVAFGGPLRYAGPVESQFIRPRSIPTQIAYPPIQSPTRSNLIDDPFTQPSFSQVPFATPDPTLLPRGELQVSKPRQSSGVVDFFRRRGKIERTRILSLFNPEDPRVQAADRGAAENQLAFTIGAFATGGALGAGSRIVSAAPVARGSAFQTALVGTGVVATDVAFNRRPQYLDAISQGQTPGTAVGNIGVDLGRDIAVFGVGSGYARSQIVSPSRLIAPSEPVGSPGRTLGSLRVDAQRFVRDDPLLVEPATGRPVQVRTDVTATRATPIERDFLGNVRPRPFEAISVRDVDTGFTRTMTFEPGRGVRTTESMIPSAVFDQSRSFGFRPVRAGSIEQGVFSDRVSLLTGTARSRGSSVFIRNVRLGDSQRTRVPELFDRALVESFDRRIAATALVQPRATMSGPGRLTSIVDTSLYGTPIRGATPLTVTPSARSSIPPPTLLTGVIRRQEPELSSASRFVGETRPSRLDVFEAFDQRQYLGPKMTPTRDVDSSLFLGSMFRPVQENRRSSRNSQVNIPAQVRVPVQRQPPATITTPRLRSPTRDFFVPPTPPRFPNRRTPGPGIPFFNLDLELPRFEQGKASNFDRFLGYDRAPRNLPSLTAAFQSGFNPAKAEKSLRGRSFTGIEIRGFL